MMPSDSQLPCRWNVARRAAFLATVRLFEHLPPPVLQRVAAQFHARHLARGDFAFLEGRHADHLNLLAIGRIKVIRETGEGREVILRLIGPGEIFGGAGGWGESVYPASARAQENAVVLQLSALEFTVLIRSDPDFAQAVVHELATRLRDAEARIRDLQSEHVERRIARLLLRLANKVGRTSERGIELGIPLSRQDLAELAGTTLGTASRTLSAWNQQGIVAAGREHVTILQPHRLLVIAEDLPHSLSRET